MIKKLQELRENGEFSKYNMIRRWQRRGDMKVYYVDDRYIAYDTEEYEEYKANVKKGRPAKMTKEFKDYTVEEFIHSNKKILIAHEGIVRQIMLKCEEVIKESKI